MMLPCPEVGRVFSTGCLLQFWAWLRMSCFLIGKMIISDQRKAAEVAGIPIGMAAGDSFYVEGRELL